MTIELGTIPIPKANQNRYPQVFTAPFTSVPIPGGFVPGNNAVFINGEYLHPGIDYNDADGNNIVLALEFQATVAEPANFLFHEILNYRTPNSAELVSAPWANYAGTADAILLTTRFADAVRSTLQDGDTVRFRATATNTDDFTINWDGLGAKQCVTESLSVAPAGYIRTDTQTIAVYDSANDWFVVSREVERDENVNGEYIKYGNGLLETRINGSDTGAGTATYTFSETQPVTFSSIIVYLDFYACAPFHGPGVNGLFRYVADNASAAFSGTYRFEASVASGEIVYRITTKGNWYEYVDPTA